MKQQNALKYSEIPPDSIIAKTAEALNENGIQAFVEENGEEAKKKILELIPKDASIMDMTSITLDTLSVSKEIQNSSRYNSIRKKLYSMDRNTQGQEMQRLGAAPDWVIGSVHAVTQDGKVMIASASGSQLPAYAYGAGKVIWVVGAQKIVKDIDEGFKRIYEHSLPLESERAKKAYGVPGSSVNKILIVNKEAKPDRIVMILVKEKLGF